MAGVSPVSLIDSYDECGNRSGAGIPITLDQCNRAGCLPDGALALPSAFAHAGAGAAPTKNVMT